MNDLDEIVRLTRDEFEPSASDRVRVKQRLSAKVAGLGLTVSLATGATAARAGSLLGGQSLGALSKLFFGSMVATWVGVGGVVAVARSVTRPVGPADVPSVQAGHGTSRPSRAAPTAPSSVSVAPAAPALPVREPAASTAPVAATPMRSEPRTSIATEAARPSASAAPAALGAELEAELGLLRDARETLADGDLTRATQALDALDQRYPEGLLLEERRALRALTNCKAGTTGDGGTVFLRRYPTSIYAAKVRRTCGLESASRAGGVTDAPSAGH